MPLARYFLAKWNAELGRSVMGWTAEVEEYLLRHPWPGNVREVENTIERGVVLARSERIEMEDLLLGAGAEATRSVEPNATSHLQAFLDQAAADRIRTVLKETSGARGDAARRLDIDRTTLYRLMRKYGISSTE